VIACGNQILARHARSHDREELVFDPQHYLALLEQKTWRAGAGGADGMGIATVLCRLLRARLNKAAVENMCRCCGYWRPSGWKRSRRRFSKLCNAPLVYFYSALDNRSGNYRVHDFVAIGQSKTIAARIGEKDSTGRNSYRKIGSRVSILFREIEWIPISSQRFSISGGTPKDARSWPERILCEELLLRD